MMHCVDHFDSSCLTCRSELHALRRLRGQKELFMTIMQLRKELRTVQACLVEVKAERDLYGRHNSMNQSTLRMYERRISELVAIVDGCDRKK